LRQNDKKDELWKISVVRFTARLIQVPSPHYHLQNLLAWTPSLPSRHTSPLLPRNLRKHHRQSTRRAEAARQFTASSFERAPWNLSTVNIMIHLHQLQRRCIRSR
ncbi:atp-dependent rna helicase, partial [Moniliophthora roreri]